MLSRRIRRAAGLFAIAWWSAVLGLQVLAGTDACDAVEGLSFWLVVGVFAPPAVAIVTWAAMEFNRIAWDFRIALGLLFAGILTVGFWLAAVVIDFYHCGFVR
jgi:hypothetical protein